MTTNYKEWEKDMRSGKYTHRGMFLHEWEHMPDYKKIKIIENLNFLGINPKIFIGPKNVKEKFKSIVLIWTVNEELESIAKFRERYLKDKYTNINTTYNILRGLTLLKDLPLDIKIQDEKITDDGTVYEITDNVWLDKLEKGYTEIIDKEIFFNAKKFGI